MIYKRVLFFFFLFFMWMNVHPVEDEFNFYDEDIDINQLKTIEVILPDTSSKGMKIMEKRYIIKVGNDGIIRSMVLTNDNGIFIYVYRKNNLLNIKNHEQKPRINNIKWDNDVYVRGLQSSFYSPEGNFTRIKVKPENDVIFEHFFSKLEKTSNNSLKETDPLSGMAFTYLNNVTEFFLSDYREFKIVYKFMPEEIMAVYYGGMYGGDMYTPPIRIIMNSDTKLHSKNQTINVINYFILNSVFTNGPQFALFPMIFLENPFAPPNNWSYTASSFLKERNAEYGANNLSSIGGLPWASANGYGIGDKITINMGASPSDSIIVINGYVSKDRPDLYTANSRVKEMKITNLNNGKSQIETVEDSKIPRTIDISDLSPNKNTRLEIEILSVYPGEKYKDLCIQSIF